MPFAHHGPDERAAAQSGSGTSPRRHSTAEMLSSRPRPAGSAGSRSRNARRRRSRGFGRGAGRGGAAAHWEMDLLVCSLSILQVPGAGMGPLMPTQQGERCPGRVRTWPKATEEPSGAQGYFRGQETSPTVCSGARLPAPSCCFLWKTQSFSSILEVTRLTHSLLCAQCMQTSSCSCLCCL